MQTLTAHEFIQLRKDTPNLTIIDLRTPAEVEQDKLDDCHCLPVHELTEDKLVALLEQKNKPLDEPLYLLCQSGKRAEIAWQKLASNNALNAVILSGGLNAIKAAGVSTSTNGRKIISLERQVRITAGSLVVLGIVLGWIIHPALFLIAGFVGAGLTFSGITDSCPMAMVLARMPWNQVTR